MIRLRNVILCSALTFYLYSCSETKPEEGALGVVDVQENRGGAKVKLDPAKDVFTIGEKQKSTEADDFLKSISDTKAKANVVDSSKVLTDLIVHIENAPIEDDLFVFGLESSNGKVLTVDIFDDKGNIMNSNRKIESISGLSFKAIKVGSLDNGIYFLRLKDETERSLFRKITIDHKE